MFFKCFDPISFYPTKTNLGKTTSTTFHSSINFTGHKVSERQMGPQVIPALSCGVCGKNNMVIGPFLSFQTVLDPNPRFQKKGATIQRPHVCNQNMHQDISRSIHFFQVRTSGCQSAFDAQPFWPPRHPQVISCKHLDHPLGLVILKNGCEIGEVTFVFWGSSKSTTDDFMH